MTQNKSGTPFISDEVINIVNSNIREFEKDLYYTEEDAVNIVSLAQDLIDLYPNSSFCALGQSPAWVINAIEKLSLLQNTDTNTYQVAFSGNMVTSRTKGSCFADFEPDNAEQYDIKAYRDYLSSVNMDPDSIIERFKKDRQKTTIVDFYQIGAGISSFSWILASWAEEMNKKDDLFNAMNIHLYFPKIPRLYQQEGLFKNEIKLKGLGAFPVVFEPCNIETFVRLGMCPANFRISPQYKPASWFRPPNPPEGLESVVEKFDNAVTEAAIVLTSQPNFPHEKIKTAYEMPAPI